MLSDLPPVCETKWTCDQCEKSFASKRALATHSARVHGYRRLVRLLGLFAVGHECHGCCRLYQKKGAGLLSTCGMPRTVWPPCGRAFPQFRRRGSRFWMMRSLAKEYAILNVKSLVFVHFFSGYPRHGDLHALLEHRQVSPGVEVFVVSVDMCIQHEQGNLIAPAAHAFWEKRIGSGQVIGAGGGPPCETFSAARFQDDGPRPLRSASSFLGGDQTYDLENGRTCWSAPACSSSFLTCCCYSPEDFVSTRYPVWLLSREPASIWSLHAVRALRLLRCVGITSFDQCELGAEAVKPTKILHLRLPTLRSLLLRRGHAGRCSHGRGAHQQLKGHQEDGAFRTAKCKIYPQGLNYRVPEDLLPFACSNFVGTDRVQPDFHGAAVQR